MAMQPPTRPAFLSRRQSYDPLSTSSSFSSASPAKTKMTLNLGSLPPPVGGGMGIFASYNNLPSGQRSVPALPSFSGAIGGSRTSTGNRGSLIGTGGRSWESWDSGADDNDWPKEFAKASPSKVATVAVGSGVTAAADTDDDDELDPNLAQTLSLPTSSSVSSPSPPPSTSILSTPSPSQTPISGVAGFYAFDPLPPPPMADELSLGMRGLSLGAGAGQSGGNGGPAGQQSRQASATYRSLPPSQQQQQHPFLPPPGSSIYPPPHTYFSAAPPLASPQPQHQQPDYASPYALLSPSPSVISANDYYSQQQQQQQQQEYSSSLLRRDSGYSSSPLPLPYSTSSSSLRADAFGLNMRSVSGEYSPVGAYPGSLNLNMRTGEYVAPGAPLGGLALPAGGYYTYSPAHSMQSLPSTVYGGYLGMELGGGGSGGGHGGGRGRSPLLEDFRLSRSGGGGRDWSLLDLANHIPEFSMDQLGSRHIQAKLETASPEEKEMVFQELMNGSGSAEKGEMVRELGKDVFGNYVVQKFFEVSTTLQRSLLAGALEKHVLDMSLQMYGCRVVQKALEFVQVDQQVRLIKELDGNVLRCAKDAQSNHVVQRALEKVPSEKLTFITDACVGQVHSLATHPYGCRVLQRIFENCPATQTRVLLDELHRYTQSLIQDQYGNYVIQWVLEKGERPDKSLVIAKVYGQLFVLAQQKFASNVIEKCIIYSTEEERKRLISEVLVPAESAPGGIPVIKAMLTHPFGNYVMQKILHTASGAQREAVFSATATQLQALRKYQTNSYSKHLVAIEKLLTSERGRPF